MNLYYLQEFLYFYKPIEPIFTLTGKISPLQRFIDGVIDLERINYIKNPYIFRENEFFVAFDVVCDIDIIFKWKLRTSYKNVTEEEYLANEKFNDYCCGIGYTYYEKCNNVYTKSFYDEEAAKNKLQIVVDDLVNVWKKYKEDYNIINKFPLI